MTAQPKLILSSSLLSLPSASKKTPMKDVRIKSGSNPIVSVTEASCVSLRSTAPTSHSISSPAKAMYITSMESGGVVKTSLTLMVKPSESKLTCWALPKVG